MLPCSLSGTLFDEGLANALTDVHVGELDCLLFHKSATEFNREIENLRLFSEKPSIES